MKKLLTLCSFAVVVGLTFFAVTGCNDAQTDTTTEEITGTGNPELDALTQRILTDPKNPELRYERAKVYYSMEGYDQAIEDLKNALIQDTTKADYFHLLADVYLDNYNSRLALNVMANAAQRFPERIPTLLKLAEFQMILKQNDNSMKTVNSILEIDPQEAEAFMMMGLNFKDVGDTDKAINSFQTAVEMDADLIDVWIILGNLFAEKKEKIAERYFNTAVSIDPENLSTVAARGTYYLQNNELEKAKKDFLFVTKKDIQNSNSFFNLGLVYIEQDSIGKANNMFDITLKTNPLYMKAYYYRGLTYELLGENKKAYADFQQLARHDPEYRDVADKLARLKPSI